VPKRPAPPPDLDRLPPQNLEAEQCVLGAMLVDVEAADIAIDALQASDFYRPAHQVIFEAICGLRAKGEAPDVVTTTFTLREGQPTDDSWGGPGYLDAMLRGLPSSKNIKRYAGEVKRRSQERQLIAAGLEVARLGYEGQEGFDEKYAQALGLLYSLEATDGAGFTPLQVAVRKHWETMCQVRDGETELVGLPTPFPLLNDLSHGLRSSEVSVIAAETGEGKTMLACQLIEWIVSHLPEAGVAVLTPEMTAPRYAGRLLTARSRYDIHRLERQRSHPEAVTDEEWRFVFEESEKLGAARVWIDDSMPRFEQARARLMRLAQRQRIDLVVVDYLQLIHSGAQFDREDQELTMMMVQFMELAKTLACHLAVVSQFSRPQSERNIKPTFHKLKGASGIEQSARLILLLWKPDRRGDRADLIVEKATHGRPGEIELRWDQDKGLFSGGAGFWKDEKQAKEVDKQDGFSPA